MTIPLALIAALLWTLPAGAQQVHTYPADCTTLQECVNDAAAGDVVRIATATPIDESPILNRSVTLEAASGVAATLAPGRFLEISHGELDGDYTVRGLHLSGGRIRTIQGSTGSMRVTIEGNALSEVSGGAAAIDVSAFRLIGTCGPLEFTVRDNAITLGQRDMGVNPGGVWVTPGPFADATGVISGNRITALVPDQGGAAIAAIAWDHDLTVDIVGNRTAGTRYDNGVLIDKVFAGGVLAARVANNVLIGSETEPTLDALVASVSGGTLVLDVANNTLARVDNGISVLRSQEGVLDARVDNNVVAHAAGSALAVEDGGAGTVVFGPNLVFDFAKSHLPAGTLLDDPAFDEALHLRPGSPAIDAGQAVAFPETDADGAARTIGPAVDLGAFEAPCDERCIDDPVTPTCDPFACDDGDPCTVDACDADACAHAPRTGLDGARCACERPLPAACAETPRPLRRAVDRACRLLARSDGAPKSLKGAGRAWQQAIKRSAGRKLSPSCAEPLGAALRDARSRTLDASR